MLSGDTATGYCMCFWLDLCIPSYSGRSNGEPFLWKFFVRLTVLLLQRFEVTHPIFKISIMLRTWLPDAFQHFVPSDNFTARRLWKTPNLTYFGSEKCQLANLVANTDWLIVTVLQATACIFRQAITVAWQRTSVVGVYQLQLFQLNFRILGLQLEEIKLSTSNLVCRSCAHRSNFSIAALKLWNSHPPALRVSTSADTLLSSQGF